MKEFITNMMSCKFLRSCELDTTTINNNRSFLMGCAIVFVFLYHAYCIMRGYLFVFQLFTYLFVGVDIFMLTSALGCSYSHEKNGTVRFYLNRIKKVVPLYLLFAIIQTVVQVFVMGETFTAFDWFCNLTTLSYWGMGGKLIDWYIASSLVLWFFTPMLKKVVSKFGWWTIVVALCVSAVVMKVFISDEWYYACFLARVPIYIAGIYIYIYGRLQPMCGLILLPLLVLTGCNGYLIISMFAPLGIWMLFWMKEKMNTYSINRAMSVLGLYTLEVYLANIISLDLFNYLNNMHLLHRLWCLVGYFVLNIILAFLFVGVNQGIKKYI